MPRRRRPVRRTLAMLAFVALLGTLVAAAPPASSSAYQFKRLVTDCNGVAVKRCATIWWASSSNRIWADIRIEDIQSDAVNYSVSVNRATIQYWTGSAWKNHEIDYDFDGWHGRVDQVYTPYAPCVAGRTYRALYYVQWKWGSAVGGTWQTTRSVTCPEAV